MPPINLIIPMPVPVAGAFPLPHRLIHSLPIILVTEEIIAIHKRCIVCLTNFICGKEVTTLPCDHVFHHRCIKKWLLRSGSCPNCREWVNREYNIEQGHQIRKQARLTAIQRYLSQVNPDTEPGTSNTPVVDLIDPLSAREDANDNGGNSSDDNDTNEVNLNNDSEETSSEPVDENGVPFSDRGRRNHLGRLISNFLGNDSDWEGNIMDYMIPLTNDDMFSLDLVDVSAEVQSVFAGLDRDSILAQIVENSANEQNNASNEGLNGPRNDRSSNESVDQNNIVCIDLTGDNEEEVVADSEPAVVVIEEETDIVASNNEEISSSVDEGGRVETNVSEELENDDITREVGVGSDAQTEGDQYVERSYIIASMERIRDFFSNLGNQINNII